MLDLRFVSARVLTVGLLGFGLGFDGCMWGALTVDRQGCGGILEAKDSQDAEATMRRKKTAVVGIACGVLCAACVFAYLQSVRGEAESARAEALSRYGGEQIEVCVARRDISAGEKVEAGALETKLWVADLLPADAARSADEVVGRTATSSVLAGEVVSLARFGEVATTIDVPEGSVALSVPAKTVQAVGGALVPGARVDMYASGDTTTSAIVRDVLVLATSAGGADGSRSTSDVAWVTVALAPELVQEVIAASHRAELYFALPSSAGSATGGAPSKSEETGAGGGLQ